MHDLGMSLSESLDLPALADTTGDVAGDVIELAGDVAGDVIELGADVAGVIVAESGRRLGRAVRLAWRHPKTVLGVVAILGVVIGVVAWTRTTDSSESDA